MPRPRKRATSTRTPSPRSILVQTLFVFSTACCSCSRGPRIAYRQHLPLVAVGLVPVDHAAAVVGADLHVLGSADRAAVTDSGGLQTRENRVELCVAHA